MTKKADIFPPVCSTSQGRHICQHHSRKISGNKNRSKNNFCLQCQHKWNVGHLNPSPGVFCVAQQLGILHLFIFIYGTIHSFQVQFYRFSKMHRVVQPLPKLRCRSVLSPPAQPVLPVWSRRPPTFNPWIPVMQSLSLQSSFSRMTSIQNYTATE